MEAIPQLLMQTIQGALCGRQLHPLNPRSETQRPIEFAGMHGQDEQMRTGRRCMTGEQNGRYSIDYLSGSVAPSCGQNRLTRGIWVKQMSICQTTGLCCAWCVRPCLDNGDLNNPKEATLDSCEMWRSALERAWRLTGRQQMNHEATLNLPAHGSAARLPWQASLRMVRVGANQDSLTRGSVNEHGAQSVERSAR